MSQWSNNNPALGRFQQWQSYWNLLLSLVSRDIRSRYRRTFLGPLWALIPAILSTAIYSLLGGLVDIDTHGAPRLVFTFAATVPWTLFQSTAVRMPHGILSNGMLLRKMPVPRQVLPLVVVMTTLFDFAMASLVLVAALLLSGMPINAHWLWLPVLTVMTVMLGWTVGIGVAAITIYRRDLLFGMQHIMQVWLFLTPVIYGAQTLQSDLNLVYRLNPAVGIIDGFRQVLVFAQPPDTGLLLTGAVLTGLGMLAAYPLYSMMSRYFADVI